MEARSSLPYSKEPAIDSCHELHESSPQIPSILISHLCLGLHNGLNIQPKPHFEAKKNENGDNNERLSGEDNGKFIPMLN
jgi:hypothetical protein